MGLKDKMLKKSVEISENRPAFTPLDLNEGNVQAIFDRCLATDKTKEKSSVVLFSTVFGYRQEDEIMIGFDKDILCQNKKHIEYLYGQLEIVHKIGNALDNKNTETVSYQDFSTSYTGDLWSSNKATVLKFLYLGCSPEMLLIKPFYKKINGTHISTHIKPTLSPKDPAFPEWWEQHKAEWED